MHSPGDQEGAVRKLNRLLLVHDHRFPLDGATVLDDGRFGDLTLYRSLAQNVVIAARTRQATPEEGLDLAPLETSGIDFVSLDAGSAQALHAIPARVGNLVEQCDGVIVRLPSRLGTLSALHAYRHGRPVLAEVVGCAWDAYWNHSLLGRLSAPMAYWLTRRAIRRADFALYVTEQFLQGRYPTNGESAGVSDVVIPAHGAEMLRRRLDRQQKRIGDPLVFCTAAAVDVRYKGHEFVLKAMSRLKAHGISVRYLIVGNGDQSRLRRLVERLGLGDSVSFLGSRSQPEVTELIRDCVDVYIQPSLQEGLPRAVVEAMSTGCPVIGSRVGGIPELIADEWLFDGGDVAALTHLIKNLTTDDLRTMAEENFRRAQGRFDQMDLRARKYGLYRAFAAATLGSQRAAT